MKYRVAMSAFATALVFASAVRAETVMVPEGTEFSIRIEDTLSSKTSTEGDRFTITLADDVKLSDGTVLHSGYRGVGEVANAKKNGRVGKKGELNIRLNYLRIGDERVKLRASKGKEGKGNTANMVVAIAFVGVFGLLVKGKNAEIPKGQRLTAFVDEDVAISTPVPAPPAET